MFTQDQWSQLAYIYGSEEKILRLYQGFVNYFNETAADKIRKKQIDVSDLFYKSTIELLMRGGL